MYCPRLIFRCFPNHLVHTWGFLAIVFRHSSNGKDLAAVRVGQQTLQGFDFAPSAFLRCLHDTDLESANVALDGRPVNGIPFRSCAGDRTNSVCCRVSGELLREPIVPAIAPYPAGVNDEIPRNAL